MTADTITYFTFNVGVMRAGYTVFVISTRNNAASITHLLNRTGARILFTSREDSIKQLARESIDALGKDVETHLMPVFEDLYTEGKYDDSASKLPTQFDRQADAMILHSSGTLSFK